MVLNKLDKLVDLENFENNFYNKFQNIEAEIAVIGCILWDNRNYEKIADLLNDDHFTNKNNKIIFKTIKNLLDKNLLVSPITLKNHLTTNDALAEFRKKRTEYYEKYNSN